MICDRAHAFTQLAYCVYLICVFWFVFCKEQRNDFILLANVQHFLCKSSFVRFQTGMVRENFIVLNCQLITRLLRETWGKVKSIGMKYELHSSIWCKNKTSLSMPHCIDNRLFLLLATRKLNARRKANCRAENWRFQLIFISF